MSVTFTFYKDSCIGIRCNCREIAFPCADNGLLEVPDEWYDFSCVHDSHDLNVSNVNAGQILSGLRYGSERNLLEGADLVGVLSPSFVLQQLDSPFCPVPVRYRDSLRALALAALECGYDVGWA